MTDIVNALFVQNGRVLLARRSPKRRAYPDVWSFPGGHVDEGESLAEALVRELREEVAVVPTTYTAMGTINDPNAATAAAITYHMYVVTSWDGGEPTIIDQEHTKLTWFAFDDAVSLTDLALDEYRTILRALAGVYS